MPLEVRSVLPGARFRSKTFHFAGRDARRRKAVAARSGVGSAILDDGVKPARWPTLDTERETGALITCVNPCSVPVRLEHGYPWTGVRPVNALLTVGRGRAA